MKKAVVVIGAIAGLALLGWVGFGIFVYSRNPAPRFALPPSPPPPANNAYAEIISCVTSVRETSKLTALSQLPDYGTPAEKEPVLEANREVLRKAQDLLQKATWVDHLEYRIGDPTVDNYRQLARLFVAQAKFLEQQGKYGQALDTYLNAFHFFEKVLGGGNGLHLTYQFMAYSEIFPAIPTLIPRLSAQDAERGARRLGQLLKDEYPLEVLLQQEFRVWLRGWQRIVREQSRRGFRLDLPKSDLERAMLYMPKAPLSKATEQYVQQWLQQAKMPYPQQQFVDYPPVLQQLGREMVVREPAGVATIVARYTYVRTRLRLLYTALRLEAYRKTHGRYPASLKDLGDSPYFIDPFSNKIFVYRPQGNSYVLYSLGPNSRDDGGASFPEGRLRREQPGDIGLVPNLPSRPS